MNEYRKCDIYTYIYEHYSALKEKDILPFAMIWINLEDIMLRGIRQTQKKTA